MFSIELVEICCDLILTDLASVFPHMIYILNGSAALRDQIKERKIKVTVLWERLVESQLLMLFCFLSPL